MIYLYLDSAPKNPAIFRKSEFDFMENAQKAIPDNF